MNILYVSVSCTIKHLICSTFPIQHATILNFPWSGRHVGFHRPQKSELGLRKYTKLILKIFWLKTTRICILLNLESRLSTNSCSVNMTYVYFNMFPYISKNGKNIFAIRSWKKHKCTFELLKCKLTEYQMMFIASAAIMDLMDFMAGQKAVIFPKSKMGQALWVWGHFCFLTLFEYKWKTWSSFLW